MKDWVKINFLRDKKAAKDESDHIRALIDGGFYPFGIMDILHDDGTSFLVISNGLLMTQEKVKRFTKYRYKWFQVSVDEANRERHDSFRQKPGSWDAAIRAVFMLSNAGIPVTVAHTVTPENLSEVDDMCDLAYSLGASGIILGEVMPSGRSWLNSDILMTREQRNILNEAINFNTQKYAGRMSVQRSSGTKIQLMRNMNTPNTGAIIRPNGDIRLDCVAPFVIGNVIDEDFCTVWNAKAHDVWGRAFPAVGLALAGGYVIGKLATGLGKAIGDGVMSVKMSALESVTA